MNENLAKARDKFIEGGGRLASGMGLPRIMGQLYATLFFGDKSLSLDEMAQNLKISKGSARLMESSMRPRGEWRLLSAL